MNTLVLGRFGLRLGGLLVLVIGIAHVFLPTWGYSPQVTLGMSSAAKEHFYFLGTYAICSFLLAFGVLAIVHSKHVESNAAQAFACVMALVWTTRVMLELSYPVEVRLFVFDNPHPVLVFVLATIAMSFTLAAVSLSVSTRARRRARQDQPSNRAS